MFILDQTCPGCGSGVCTGLESMRCYMAARHDIEHQIQIARDPESPSRDFLIQTAADLMEKWFPSEIDGPGAPR